MQNELNNYKKENNLFIKKEHMYKNQLNLKQKEITKLKSDLKALNTNSTINNKLNSNTIMNNNSNLSMLIKSKMNPNSTFYTMNKDEIDHNTKQKYEDIFNVYNQNLNNDNIYFNKNRTMSNIKPSRNKNYFTVINKPSNKNSNINNNISQLNTIININSYLHKNFSSNSLRKNNSNNNQRKNYINSRSKKKNFKQNINNSMNSSSLSITNNTYNMNKNNIMINLNPKSMNTNMNIEKLKVQNKLYEYQKLIDQKLNELIRNKHYYIKNNKNSFHIRRNSSPNYNNSQRKNTSSSIGLEYYLKKTKKKSITPNTHLNKNNVSKKQLVRTNIQMNKDRKNVQRTSSKSVKKNKSNINNINNLKQNLNKGGYYSQFGDDYIDSSKVDREENTNGKINLSLRKFIFTKCGNPSFNCVNKKY